MNFKQSLIVALPALMCGALLGFLAAPTTAPAPIEEEAAETAEAPKPERQAKPATDDAALNRLRQRVKELERQLAARSTEAAEPIEPSTNRPPEVARREGPPDFRNRMEDMRMNDPERYTQMTNRFASWRASHIQRVQDRLNLLASMDTSRMSPKQREDHLRYQELVARQTELGDQLRPGGAELSGDERRQMHQQLQQISHELNRLGDVERNTLLQQTALSFGLKGKNASEAVETIKAVYQATESGWGGPGGGRGPGGPGGGRGGRGGGFRGGGRGGR
jgi:hypothetical protein